MTLIVGLVHDGIVYMGCDSAAYQDVMFSGVTRYPKVFFNGKFLIGYTSSFRMGQLLQYHLKVDPQKEDQSDMEYMVTVFVDAVRQVLKDNGFTSIENNTETIGTFLVGYKGNLYVVESDLQVNGYTDPFAAVGCGYAYGLSAMLALPDLLPEERILKALEIAAHFSPAVCVPFIVETLKPV